MAQEDHAGRQVDALLLAEPVISPDDTYCLPTGFIITAPNPDSPITSNPHLNTAILYRAQTPDVSFTEEDVLSDGKESDVEEGGTEHLGVTVLEMLVMNEAFPSVIIISTYLPNKSVVNTAEYIDSLTTAIITTVNKAVKAGCPVIIGVDTNCPFRTRGAFPPSTNSPVLKRILDEAGIPSGRKLVVMNWAHDTTGFNTRSRAGDTPHQLDMFLVTDDISNRCSLNILEDVNFNSDHYMLSLLMRSNTPTKAKESVKKVKKYKYTEEGKNAYREALKKPLEEYAAQAKHVLRPEASENERPDHKTVDVFVTKLSTIILETCDSTLEFSYKTVISRPPRPPAPDSVIATAIAHREQARKAHMQATAAGASTEEQMYAKYTYKTAKEAVQSLFTKATHDKHAKVWRKMQETYKDDKAAFFEAFGKLIDPDSHPLPRSLHVNGEEVRRPSRIKAAWIARFHLPDVETGDDQDKAFRAETEQENARRSKIKTHENAFYNKRYVVEDVEEALGPKAKLGKKAGTDLIENEMLKYGGKPLHSCLTHLFNIMHEAERVAKEWKTTPIGPFYKKGDLRKCLNFRPVTFMSNIYKAYERCVDPRIRGAIVLPDSQCGFRKRFGPLTTLMRMKIVLAYCASNNIDLFMVFIDFKQAFERVWRGGLLARLWQMGVRGKMWRIIKDMLTGTKSYVQTNFGDTEPWDVDMGIIQGSVLSAVLFIIFISHLSTDLEHLAPVINGITFPPQLFADDGTLLAVGDMACRSITDGTVEWAAKWKMVLNMVKSKSMALAEDAPQLYEDESLFSLVSNAVSLGVGIDRRGVYSMVYLRTLLKRLVTRVKSIMQAGVRLGALRPDMGMHLYTTLAQSIVKYALPLSDPSSKQVQQLEEQQERFALDFLSLPLSTPPHAAKAELGLIDYDLRSRVSKLLLHHRIQTSPDAFTRKLLVWDLGNGSTLSSCRNELRTLMPSSSWERFTNLPYQVAKTDLKDAATKTQIQRWREHERTQGHLTANAGISKPQWGLENSLTQLPPMDVVTYIGVRNGAGIKRGHVHEGKCAKCNLHPQSELHILWTCEGTRAIRNRFITTATQKAPQSTQRLVSLTPQPAFHFLMGAGAKVTRPEEWKTFQGIAVSFVAEIFKTEKGP